MIRQLTSLFGLCLLIAFAIGAVHATEASTTGSEKPVPPVQHIIEITEFEFSPMSLGVKPGDTVTWTNIDIVPHTASALDGSWDTASLAFGESYSLVITEDMDFNYFCRFHPMMKASLTLVQ